MASRLRRVGSVADASGKGPVLIDGMFNTGAMPALERMVQFTGQRHKLIAHNVANLSTPHFRPTDVNPADFQAALSRAVTERRERAGGPNGDLLMRDTQDMRFGTDRITFKPTNRDDNLLFHDRNNRSLEHLMKDLAENAGAHNTALELMRNQFEMLKMAIRERM